MTPYIRAAVLGMGLAVGGINPALASNNLVEPKIVRTIPLNKDGSPKSVGSSNLSEGTITDYFPSANLVSPPVPTPRPEHPELTKAGYNTIDFKQLQEIEVNDIDQYLYIMKRCAAISILMSLKMNHPDTASTSKIMMDNYDIFATKAYEAFHVIARKNKTAVDGKEANFISEDIKSIYKSYESNMDESYLKTGGQLSSLILSDSKYCLSTAKGLE